MNDGKRHSNLSRAYPQPKEYVLGGVLAHRRRVEMLPGLRKFAIIDGFPRLCWGDEAAAYSYR